VRTRHRRKHLPSALVITLLLASLLSIISVQTGGHSSDTLAAPTLLSPLNGENIKDNTPLMDWLSVSGATEYYLQIDNDNDYSSPNVDNDNIPTDNYEVPAENALPEGWYYWRVRAENATENGPWSENWIFQVDVTAPPAPTLAWPADGENINDNTPNLDWSPVTDPSTLVIYDVQVDDNSDFSSPEVNVTGITTDNYITFELIDNLWNWRVRARDNAGNIGSWSSSRSFRVDTLAPPAPTLVAPADGTRTNDNSKAYDWSDVTDNSLPITYEWQVDNDNDFSSPYSTVNGLSTSQYGPVALPDENWSWYVRARDNAGNYSTWSSAWTILIDTTPPAAPTLEWPANGENINDNTPNLDWNTVTENSLPVLYRCHVSDNSAFPYDNYDSGWVSNDNFQITSEMKEGVWCWRVQTKDNASNIGDNSAYRSFRVDVTKPTTPSNVSPVNGENTNDNTPLLDWSDSTDVSLPITYNLYVDNDSNFSSVDYTQTGLTSSQYQFTSELAEKVWYWRVQARDNAGNVGDNSTSRSFRVDVTKPQAPALVWPANGENENDNTPTLDWNSVSDNSTPVLYRCYVDNNSDFSSVERDSGWISATEYTTPALAESIWYWKVGAKDNAGNVGDNSASRSFRVDTTPPGKPTLALPENNKLDNSMSQTFKWTQPPENSLPLTYHIQIDNEASFTSPYVRENMGVGENSYIYSFTSAGTYYWRVRAKDNAGNWGAWSDNFKLAIVIPVGVSPTKPVLVSPANGAKINDNTPTFQWTKGENAENHRLLVDNDPDFSSPADNILLGAADNIWTKSAPGYVDGTYYWSVVAVNAAGENRSLKWAFRVETVPPVAPTSARWLLIAGILTAVMIGLAVALYTKRRRVSGKRRGILRGL